MPLISEINLLQKPEQAILSIRFRTPVEKLPMHIGESYAKIAAYMGDVGIHPSGDPFVAYHNMDMQDLDVEIGFPVASPIPGKEDIRSCSIPAGLFIFAMYQGPYEQMKDAYDEIGKYIEQNKLVPSGVAYEIYYNGPDVLPDKLLTKIEFALK